MSHIIFPTEEDFNNEDDEVVDSFKAVESIIDQLCEMPISDYNSKTNQFIEKTLPSIWKRIHNYNQPTRSVQREVTNLGSYVCKLCAIDLSSKLLSAIVNSFTEEMKNPTKDYTTKIEILPEEVKETLFEFPADGKYLRSNKLASGAQMISLINQILTSGIFRRARELNKERALTYAQAGPLLSLFIGIESSLENKYVSLLLPEMMDISINLLQDHGTEYNHNHFATICGFISRYIHLIPDKLDTVYELFGTLSKSHNIQAKFCLISEMITIVEKCGISNSGMIIKGSLVSAVLSNSQQNLLRHVYNFLPKLDVDFSDEDLINLSIKTRSCEAPRFQAICQILTNTKRNVDSFAQEVLNSNILYPEFYCTLIGVVQDPAISGALFHKLLRSPLLLKQYSNKLSSIPMNDRLLQHMHNVMSSKEDISLLTSLSFFYLNAPKLSSLRDFIMNVIKHAEEYPEPMFSILDNFSDIINDFKSQNIMMDIFDIIFQKIMDSNVDSYIHRLISVLTDWFESSRSIPCNEIFQKLEQIDFSKCPDELTILINIVIEKSGETIQIKNFLFKMLHDTTPKIHAQWLIETLFKLFHSDQNIVSEACDVLIQQLDDPNKRGNAVYLLYWAVLYEVDNYRIGEEFGFTREFKFIYENQTQNAIIGFHPFQSTSRIFIEASKIFNLRCSSITLHPVDESLFDKEDFVYNMPLTVLTNDNKNKPIEIKVSVKNEDFVHEKQVDPIFLERLETHKNELFNLLTCVSDSNELLFLILLLFQPIEQNSTNSLQNIITSDCSDPFEFENSTRIFPIAVACTKYPLDASRIVANLLEHEYDQVGFALLCHSLLVNAQPIVFSTDVLKRALIQSRSSLLRTVVLNLISEETDVNELISLIPITLEKRNRTSSKQYYECLRKYQMDPEIFVPFYKQLVQYEFSHYTSIDETFIAMTKLLPKSKEMIELTASRLFAAPTCKAIYQPFVHTIESWQAALEFLTNEESVPVFTSLLDQLNHTPSLDTKLSNDYTYLGRSGIKNLGSTCYVNSLLQVLNAYSNFSLKLISRPTEKLSPFVMQLRDILAHLRFVRGDTLSIRPLISTIQRFNVAYQEDAEEFLMKILNRLHEELEDSNDIINTIQTQVTCIMRTETEEISRTPENFFYLSLQTQGFQRLEDSFRQYFENEVIEGYKVEGTDFTQNVYRHNIISKWPDFLVIHLKRYEFTFEAKERNKLVHQFDFPLYFMPNSVIEGSDSAPCDFDYTLAGVVVHQGTAEQGHYFAIVKGDDDEWYVCNDHKIQYFDLNEISSWAFGISEDSSGIAEDVCTGYLLFYKREGMENISVSVPSDLEERLNKENMKMWPTTIFYSSQFAEFIFNLMMMDTTNDQAVENALIVLFKVAIEQEELLENWVNVFRDQIFITTERCHLLFNFIEKKIGNALPHILSLSDGIAAHLTTLILIAFNNLRDTSRPLYILLNSFDDQTYKRAILQFIFDLISSACKNLSIDWNNDDESEVIMLMIKFVSIEMSKDILRNISKPHSSAFNQLMGILFDMIRVKGCTPVILSVFEIPTLNKVFSTAKKSENFNKLIVVVNTLRPDIFVDLNEALPGVKAMLSQLLPIQAAPDIEEPIELDLNIILPTITQLLFCEYDQFRKEIADAFIRTIGDQDEVMVQYIKESIVKADSQKPPHGEESTVALYVTGLVPKMTELIKEGKDELCACFLDLVLYLSTCAPYTLLINFEYLVENFCYANSEEMKKRLLTIIHHQLAYDKSIASKMGEEQIKAIMGSSCASEETTQFLVLFRDYADKSPLSGACVQYYFDHDLEDNAFVLLRLLDEGLVPGDFEIPKEATDIIKLKLANSLWNRVEDKWDELSRFMLSSLKFARPIKLFERSSTIRQAREILEKYCPEELKKIIDTI